MSISKEQRDRQKQRERRISNRFYERLAALLVFVILVFTGISMFVSPKEKVEFNFDKMNISEDIKHEESAEINLEPAKIEENININEELNEVIQPKKHVSNYSAEERRRLIEMRKKDMQKILEKQLAINKKPQRQQPVQPINRYPNYNTPKVAYEEGIPTETQKYQEPPIYTTPAQSVGNGNGNDDFFDILLNNATCRREEIEYILKLFTSKYSNPITLVFRRNGHETGTPEIIYATLPNNQWKDISESLGNVMQTLLEELLKDENSSANSDMKKVTAMITTECSDSQYVSQSFYVSNTRPATTTVSSAASYCNSKHGRLPDILELISIVTHKSMPSGYYITNSERLSTDRYGQAVRPLGDYLILELRGNNIYFNSSSKIPTQSVYAECVLK